MSARPLPLPPYGVELRAWLCADSKPHRWGCNGNQATITVALGSTAWSFAHEWHGKRLVLVVPPGESPEKYNWRVCSGHDPILIQLCDEVADGAIDSLVCALLRDGVQRVLELETMNRFQAEGVCRAA